MRASPLLAEGESPASRIRVLHDRDKDGRFETAQTFADGLLFPTGLQPWRGGVILTSAGEIVYLKDMDYDGRADHREVRYRSRAIRDAKSRAEVYAQAAGVGVGPVWQVSEQAVGPPQPLRLGTEFRAEAAGVPIATGEQEYRATINVVYNLNIRTVTNKHSADCETG